MRNYWRNESWRSLKRRKNKEKKKEEGMYSAVDLVIARGDTFRNIMDLKYELFMYQ